MMQAVLVGCARAWSALTLLVALVVVAGCATAPVSVVRSVSDVHSDGVVARATDAAPLPHLAWRIGAEAWETCGQRTRLTQRPMRNTSALATFELIGQDGESVGLHEWYGRDAHPYLHGITLPSAPACGTDSEISLWLRSSRPLRAMGGEGISFDALSPEGGVYARYRDLRVFSADGAAVPFTLAQVDASGLQLTLDVSSARFPVTIDPWMEVVDDAVLGTSSTSLPPLAWSAELDWLAVGRSGSESAPLRLFNTVSGAHSITPTLMNVPSEAINSDFGTELTFVGPILAVAALPEEETDKHRAGHVYLYAFDESGHWTLSQILDPTVSKSARRFGAVLAGSDDILAVASPGRAWEVDSVVELFRREAQTLERLTQVASPEAGKPDGFGRAVSVSGHLLFVGAPLSNVGAPQAGAVHVFNLNELPPTLRRTLRAQQRELRGRYGLAVAGSERWLAIADAPGRIEIFAREADDLALVGDLVMDVGAVLDLGILDHWLWVRRDQEAESFVVFELETLQRIALDQLPVEARARMRAMQALSRNDSRDGAGSLATFSAKSQADRIFHSSFEAPQDQSAPSITLTSPEDGAFLATLRPNLSISYLDLDAGIDPASLRWLRGADTIPVACDAPISASSGALTCRPTSDLQQGLQAWRISLADRQGNRSAEVVRTVTVDTVPPAAIAESAVATSAIVNGWRVQVRANAVPVDAVLAIRIQGRAELATLVRDGEFLITDLTTQPGDSLLVAARDMAGNESDPVILTPGLPPDPRDVAPPMDDGGAGNFGGSVGFIHLPPNPIQIGLDPGTLEPTRVAVVRGEVRTRAGAALPGVRVTVQDHPEYGYTLSRIDGQFDLVLNGGGTLVIEFHKSGYLFAQRQVEVPWHDFATVETVALVELDDAVTRVEMGSTLPQIAIGSEVEDSAGSRQPAVYFPPGTQAQMVLADGSTLALDQLDVRMTEYTVGPNGPSAMPAPLPPTTAYTYAVELSVDQALQEGTKIDGRDVLFDRQVSAYVDNFMDFPVGMRVPSGYYDNTAAQWKAVNDGRVLKVLAIVDGRAVLDADGNGTAASSATLSALGIDDSERGMIAGRFAPGMSFWRVQLSHFSTWDWNWGFGLPLDAIKHFVKWLLDPIKKENEPCVAGCEIGGTSRNLGESVAAPGIPGALRYDSSRLVADAGLLGPTINLTLTPDYVPPSLKRVDLELHLLGRVYKGSYPAVPNYSTRIALALVDPYYRSREGTYPFKIRVGYVYKPLWRGDMASASGGGGGGGSRSFGSAGALPLTGDRERAEIIEWWEDTSSITYQSAQKRRQTAGWQLQFQHVLDVTSGTMMMGNGRTVAALDRPELLDTLAGSDRFGSGLDGAPAVGFTLNTPGAIAVDDRGRIFVADTANHRIRRIDTDGAMTSVAGIGSPGFSGDNGPATAAQLSNPSALSFDAQGRLYIADRGNHRIRRIERDGRIVTVAGTGTPALATAGQPASTSSLNDPRGVSANRFGVVFIADTGNHRVWSIQPDGSLVLIAGGGSGSSQRGVDTALQSPTQVAADDLGNAYVLEAASRVRVVGADGLTRVVAGGGTDANASNVPATQALIAPGDIAVDGNQRLLIADAGQHRIRRVDGNGLIVTLAGTGNTGYAANGLPARNLPIEAPQGIAIDRAGRVLFTHFHALRRIGHEAAPTASAGEITVADPGGEALHVFDTQGRHLRTLDALTGGVLYSLEYVDGDVVAMVDAFGNRTRIERDATGQPTGLISPDNLRTGFTLDSRGYLKTLTTPENRRTEFEYNTSGLMQFKIDAREHRWDYGYDANGRLISDSRPDGSGWTITSRDLGNGSETDFTSRLGRTSTYGVVNEPDGTEIRYSRAPDATESHTTIDPAGTRTTLSADGTQSQSEQSPHPRFGTQAMLPARSVLETPLGLRAEITQQYQATPAGVRDPADLSTWTETTTVNGRDFVTAFDQASLTFTSTTPEGRGATLRVNAQRQPLTLQVPGLADLTYAYDARGRLETIRQSDGTTTREYAFGYDAFGYLHTVTDPLLRTVTIDNDRDGRPTKLTLPDQREIGLATDPNGNVSALTTPKQHIHRFGYDELDRETRYEAPAIAPTPTVTTTDFDTDGNPDLQTLPGSVELDFSYDAAGRLLNVSRPEQDGDAGNEVQLAYAYDGFLVTSETSSGAITGAVGFGYDNEFRLTTLTAPGATTGYGFDDDGLLTRATLTPSAGAPSDLTLTRDAANGLLQGTQIGTVADTWEWSAFAEPRVYAATLNGAALYRTQFERDALERITQKTETIQGVTTTFDYRYDLAGRLDQVTINGAVSESYTYDANGNRETLTRGNNTTTYEVDAQDRLLRQGDCTYTYTANGELETQTCANQTTRYRYSLHGDLTAVELPNGAQLEYVVDGKGRRVGKRRNGQLEQGFLYFDQLDPIVELDGNGQPIAQFVYADRAHVPALMQKGGKTYRFISDHIGSVRLVIDTGTGQVAQRLDYDAWGKVTLDTAPGFQPFGFAGGIYDRDTGLTRFGARDVAPETGRWLTKDISRFAGKSISLYAYANSNPVNLVDLSGLQAIFLAQPPLIVRPLPLLRPNPLTQAVRQGIRENAEKPLTGQQRIDQALRDAGVKPRGDTKPEIGQPPPQELPPRVRQSFWETLGDLLEGFGNSGRSAAPISPTQEIECMMNPWMCQPDLICPPEA